MYVEMGSRSNHREPRNPVRIACFPRLGLLLFQKGGRFRAAYKYSTMPRDALLKLPYERAFYRFIMYNAYLRFQGDVVTCKSVFPTIPLIAVSARGYSPNFSGKHFSRNGFAFALS